MGLGPAASPSRTQPLLLPRLSAGWGQLEVGSDDRGGRGRVFDH